MKTEMKTGARRKFLKTMKVLHETTRGGRRGAGLYIIACDSLHATIRSMRW